MGDDKKLDSLCACGHVKSDHATEALLCTRQQCQCSGFKAPHNAPAEEITPKKLLEEIGRDPEELAKLLSNALQGESDRANLVEHWKEKFGVAEAEVVDLRERLGRMDQHNQNQVQVLKEVYKAIYDTEPTFFVGLTQMAKAIRKFKEESGKDALLIETLQREVARMRSELLDARDNEEGAKTELELMQTQARGAARRVKEEVLGIRAKGESTTAADFKAAIDRGFVYFIPDDTELDREVVRGGRHYISCKDHEGQFVTYEVHSSVYLYVQQLEAAVRHPDITRIREAYPKRFKVESEQLRSLDKACLEFSDATVSEGRRVRTIEHEGCRYVEIIDGKVETEPNPTFYVTQRELELSCGENKRMIDDVRERLEVLRSVCGALINRSNKLVCSRDDVVVEGYIGDCEISIEKAKMVFDNSGEKG